MYLVSDKFKKVITNNARYINCYIVYERHQYFPSGVTLDSNIYSNEGDTNTFIGTFIAKNGTIKFKSDDTINLENKSFDLFFGVKLEDGTYENINIGTFHVYEKISNVEYKIIDSKMLFNIYFDQSKVFFPTTLSAFVLEVCKQAEVDLENKSFPNCNLVIPNEIDLGYEPTCEKAIVAAAQASCSFAQINSLNHLEFKWFKKVDFNLSIDNMLQKSVICDKYGPINSLVLASEPQGDYVYIQDESSIEVNGLTEFKITNNPFLNIDRYASRDAIFERVNNFMYIPCVFKSQGYFHLENGDIITVETENGFIDFPIMNHMLNYAGGISSSLDTPALSKNEINYSIASKENSAIYNVELKVDKVNKEITSQVSEISNEIFKFETGEWNIFNNCNQSIDIGFKDDMFLDIDKSNLKGKDICISCYVNVVDAVHKSGMLGAEFEVGFNDGTKEKYSTLFVAGQNSIEYVLSCGNVTMDKRIYAHYKIPDKEIISVSSLRIFTTMVGVKQTISRPKVEFGTYPTGYQFDVPYVRDNVVTLQKDYTLIKQEVSTLSLQAVSMETEITTIKGDVTEVEKRLQSTELKLTPTEITAMVNEKIGADGQLTTVKVTIDKNGLDVKNGAISITNNEGVKVLYADTNGNLVGNKITINNLQSTSGKIGKFNIDDKGFNYTEAVSIDGKACTFTLDIHPDARDSFMNWKLKTDDGTADEIIGALTYSGIECKSISAMTLNSSGLYTSDIYSTNSVIDYMSSKQLITDELYFKMYDTGSLERLSVVIYNIERFIGLK